MRHKKNTGMAMLEVLIAMGIVAISILPLVYLQVKAGRSVVSTYTKIEHNAAALSIMDMVSADTNKKSWIFNLASGDCDNNQCNASTKWRQKVTDDLLTSILPNAGSSLVCITQEPLVKKGGGALDRTMIMTVTLWWYSAGRGKADIGGHANIQDSKSKEGAFNANACNQLSTLADKLNIDTVSVRRIFYVQAN